LQRNTKKYNEQNLINLLEMISSPDYGGMKAKPLLKKNGYKIGFFDFPEVGLPFTLVAVAAGAIFIWIFWS